MTAAQSRKLNRIVAQIEVLQITLDRKGNHREVVEALDAAKNRLMAVMD